MSNNLFEMIMISKFLSDKRLILFYLLIFSKLSVCGQEILIHIATENKLPNQIHSKNLKKAASLSIPFFEDFSDSYYYPDTNKWADNLVFINGTYPVDPPSVGVATLDAVDNTGNFYPEAGYGNSFEADKLTSKPINLDYPSDNSIFLSFYYQPQGLADNPESQDTLFLDFYAPELDRWDKAWTQTGYPLSNFKQKIIQISDSKYLKDGFRFRFRNKATLSGQNEPSEAINCDHWNIDYIYLNRNRTINDTIAPDIAFVYPMASILRNYESMPWKHYLSNPSGQLSNNVSASLQNNDNKSRLIDSLYFVFYDNSGSEPNDTLTAGSHDILPGEQKKFNPPYTDIYNFITNSVDSASFDIKARFVTDGYDPTINNEVIYTQKFYDYYAYDDGSAEAGYGLTGSGAQNALLAIKFDCIKQDTLKAIQMCFNRSLDKTKRYFFLTIWDDNNGIPGKVIYQRKGFSPEFENELNKFQTFIIDDTVLVINRVFYVGWKQTTADLLNIGFDYNRDRKLNNFYNINGTWENSMLKGSIMIRPFFGKMLTTRINPKEQNTSFSLRIYPNPATNEIYIRFSDGESHPPLNISIFNISGKVLYQSTFRENQAIDISGLYPGTYFMRLNDKSNKINISRKFIKL